MTDAVDILTRAVQWLDQSREELRFIDHALSQLEQGDRVFALPVNGRVEKSDWRHRFPSDIKRDLEQARGEYIKAIEHLEEGIRECT